MKCIITSEKTRKSKNRQLMRRRRPPVTFFHTFFHHHRISDTQNVMFFNNPHPENAEKNTSLTRVYVERHNHCHKCYFLFGKSYAAFLLSYMQPNKVKYLFSQRKSSKNGMMRKEQTFRQNIRHIWMKHDSSMTTLTKEK